MHAPRDPERNTQKPTFSSAAGSMEHPRCEEDRRVSAARLAVAACLNHGSAPLPQTERRRHSRRPRARHAASVLLFLSCSLSAAGGYVKLGVQGRGSPRERSMASPAASTPTT
jgi:hypothetical protein